MKIIGYIFSFLFGSAIGSFMNVLIYRMPLGKSIIKPNSFCPHCKKAIAWYENIPVLSFVMLGGRCSKCHKPISIHYPLVEIISGLVFLYLFGRYGLQITFFFYVYYFCILIIISGIDFSHQIIPDILSIPGIFVGILFQIVNNHFLSGLVAALFGGGLILLVRIIGGRVYKKEVMGMGDVYLTAMIGAFVGWPFILVAIFMAALSGAVIGMVYVLSTRQSRESPIPFGPFLSFGGISVVIFDSQTIQFFSMLGLRM